MRGFYKGVVTALIIGALGFFPIMRDIWSWTLGASATWVGYGLNQATHKIYTFFTVVTLDKEIAKLQHENTALKAENTKYKEVIAESKLIQQEEQAAIAKGYAKNSITARIIGKSSANFLQTYVLDKGKNDGVEVGNATISNGFLVGRIVSVNNNLSTADVISGGQLYLPVILQESRSVGMIRGGLEGLIVSEIPQDTTPKEGEIVLTQNIENIIPPNIAIGYVQKVINHKGDIFQSAVVESPLDLTQLRIITIIKN